jgi:hypothetical protein
MIITLAFDLTWLAILEFFTLTERLQNGIQRHKKRLKLTTLLFPPQARLHEAQLFGTLSHLLEVFPVGCALLVAHPVLGKQWLT